MKAQESPVQSIEPHRILAPTLDLNQGPPGPWSKVVATILLLHIMNKNAIMLGNFSQVSLMLLTR